MFYHEVVPITMHEEIEGVDSELELYIQYFDKNFREMHASFIKPRKEVLDELLHSEEDKEETEEELFKKDFSTEIKQRIEGARRLRKEKRCLQYGVNVPLKCFNPHGKINTILAYCRHTRGQIGVVISNFEDEEKEVWVDFSSLNPYMKNLIEHETTILRVEYWNQDLPQEYHLINEFLNCPHMFKISPHDSVCFEVIVNGDIHSNPEFYWRARDNFIKTLEKIHESSHMETSNIYSGYIKHLAQCYHQHRNPDYEQTHKNIDANLADYHKFISNDSNVMKIIEEIVEKNSMGPIVFVTPELAPWFKIGGLAVMVDELARGFATLGEDTYVIVPFYEHKKGGKEKIELDPKGEYGIKYQNNIEVQLGNMHETFGVHYGKVNGVHIYFIHHSILFSEPYPGYDNISRLKSCTFFSKATLQVL